MNNNVENEVRQLSRYNSRRSSVGLSHKPYESMLLKELPGAKRSNAAMHAVLESALEDNGMQQGMHEAQKVRNHALIHYLASLANSNNNDDVFDFDFVESLIENGADVNSTDRNGQTIFHEVARSWNLDVALFLLENGADLNQQDKFGRSPLHVAAAVDYADMVRFLVKHGANINIATYGEQQMPIHYAAKNDACKSLKMLLGYGANIDSRDSKNRTPLQVAAEMNRAKSAKLLVQNGAPAGVHDNMGNSALSLLIEKLPDVAIEALDQFHSVSTINRKEFFFLNYLEGNKLQDPKSPAYSALEIAVQNQEFDIILHPVMKRLIDVKWQQFGRKGAIINLGLNLLYAIMWTVLAVTSTTDGQNLYLPWSENVWRLVVSIIVCLMTTDEIRRQITGTMRTRKHQKKWICWRASELEEDLKFCHPRWQQEEMYLKSEIKAIRDTPLISTGDSWIYFDWFSLILILGTIASHVAFFNLNTPLSQVIYARIITMLIVVLWIRIMQYARPFEGAGPFVAIFGHIFSDIVNWGILTLLITIPYACAFWITFGKVSRYPVESYSDVSSLLYLLFSMIVVNDHDFEALQEADATMARLLCGSYIAWMAIINLNILIALLSDTFTRVYGNAVANAVMQRAKTILFLEKSLSKKKRREYHEFVKNFGSPESVDLQRDISANNDRDEQKAADVLKESVKEIHCLLHERFGTQYGEGKMSDLDHIKESLQKIHQGSNHEPREKCECKGIKRKIGRIQEMLVILGNSLNIDLSKLENKQESSSSDDTLVAQLDEGLKRNLNSRSDWGEKADASNHDHSSQGTVTLSVSGQDPEQQFWSANKAAVNDGYHFEEGESPNGRSARNSLRRGSEQAKDNMAYNSNGFRKNSRSIDLGHSDSGKPADKRKSRIEIPRSNRDDDYLNSMPHDPAFSPYTQSRDSSKSRADRRQFRTDVYQKRPTDHFSAEARKERVETRERLTDDANERHSQRYFDKGSPERKVRSQRSISPMSNASLRRPRESPEHESRLRKHSPDADSKRRQMAERPWEGKDIPQSSKRSPVTRRSQNNVRRDSDTLKRRVKRQRAPRTSATYSSKRNQEHSTKHHDEPPRHARSGSESDTNDSETSSYDGESKVAYSDNDVINKRATRLREKRYLDDWDTRSAKSVAF